MLVVDAEQALALLEEVVSEHGEDHISETADGTCVYWMGDQPSCIVGHVLHKLNLTPDHVQPYAQIVEYLGEVRPYEDDVDRGWKIQPFTEAAQSVLRAAQAVQDDARPWGAALKAARLKANRDAYFNNEESD